MCIRPPCGLQRATCAPLWSAHCHAGAPAAPDSASLVLSENLKRTVSGVQKKRPHAPSHFVPHSGAQSGELPSYSHRSTLKYLTSRSLPTPIVVRSLRRSLPTPFHILMPQVSSLPTPIVVPYLTLPPYSHPSTSRFLPTPIVVLVPSHRPAPRPCRICRARREAGALTSALAFSGVLRGAAPREARKHEQGGRSHGSGVRGSAARKAGCGLRQ